MKYLTPKAEHLKTMVANIDAGRFTDGLTKAKAMGEEELRKVYQEREMEPAVAGEDWTPQSNENL